MTRGALIARVARKMGLSTDEGSEDLEFLQDLANEAVIEVLQRTHCYLDIGEMALTAGTSEYRLDSAILAVDDIRTSTPAGEANYELIPLEEMIRRQSAGIQSGSVKKYLSFDGNLMIVSPTPDTSEVIRFYFVPKPTPMTDDSHDPSLAAYGGIPEPHRALEYFMLWQVAEDTEKKTPMSPADYLSVFQNECVLMRRRKRGLAGRRLGPAQVGYPGSRRVPLRNDTYPQR